MGSSLFTGEVTQCLLQDQFGRLTDIRSPAAEPDYYRQLILNRLPGKSPLSATKSQCGNLGVPAYIGLGLRERLKCGDRSLDRSSSVVAETGAVIKWIETTVCPLPSSDTYRNGLRGWTLCHASFLKYEHGHYPSHLLRSHGGGMTPPGSAVRRSSEQYHMCHLSYYSFKPPV